MPLFKAFWLALLISCFGVHGSLAVTSTIELTPEEQSWLADHPAIRVSGPVSFPPFHYINEKGQFQGMAADYVILLAGMVGLNVEYAAEKSWAEILEKIEKKELDVLACAAESPKREQYLAYTTPHLSFPIVIISRKDGPFISGLESLHEKRIALTKGIMIFDWLKRDGIQFTPLHTRSMAESLEQVSLGGADATLQNLAAATYLIDKKGLTNLKVAAPSPYGNYNLSIAVRKDWPELVSIFNKALAAVDQHQHEAIRQKWIAVRYEHGVRYQELILWVGLIFCVAGLMVATFFFWNRKLKQEIFERKQTEQEKERLIIDLKKAVEEIKTLQGILPLCSFCKKIRDEDGRWQQVDVYLHKHSQADVSHGICPDCAQQHYPDYFASDKNVG